MLSLKTKRAGLAAAAAAFTLTVLAATPAGATGTDFVYEPDTTCGANGSVRITGYVGTIPSDLVIPSTIDGHTVTSVTSQPQGDAVGFAGAGIRSLALPSTVICIEAQAFENNDIADLTLPSSVRAVATGAFARNKISTLSVESAGDGIAAPFLLQNPTRTVPRDAVGELLPISELLDWSVDGRAVEWTVADPSALPEGVVYDEKERSFRIDQSVTSFTFAGTMTDSFSVGSVLITYDVDISDSGVGTSDPHSSPAETPTPTVTDEPATGGIGS